MKQAPEGFEVRAIGTELGLPDDIVWRQPFPGPGLGIRTVGAITRERTYGSPIAYALIDLYSLMYVLTYIVTRFNSYLI